MHSAIAVLALASLANAGGLHAEPAEKMKNVDFIAKGYNLFYGNPMPTGAGKDPGFILYAGQQIFKQSYETGQTSGDGRYLIPDGFELQINHGCSLTFSSSTSFSTSAYKSNLEVKATADFSGYGAAFSASSSYKSFQQHASSSKQKMVSSTAECVVYTLSTKSFAKPALSGNFEEGVSKLPEDYGDGSAYFNLFDAFGTHHIPSMTLGSRFGFTSYFNEEGWDKVEKTGVDMKMAAKYQGTVSAGISLESEQEKEARRTFAAETKDEGIISLGKKPTDGDATKWAKQVIDEPMPISYRLESVCDLLEATGPQKDNCKKAQSPDEYCTKRLKDKRRDVSSCSKPRDVECLWNEDCSDSRVCRDGNCTSPLTHGMSVYLKQPGHPAYLGMACNNACGSVAPFGVYGFKLKAPHCKWSVEVDGHYIYLKQPGHGAYLGMCGEQKDECHGSLYGVHGFKDMKPGVDPQRWLVETDGSDIFLKNVAHEAYLGMCGMSQNYDDGCGIHMVFGYGSKEDRTRWAITDITSEEGA